jgi:hypothetical protein
MLTVIPAGNNIGNATLTINNVPSSGIPLKNSTKIADGILKNELFDNLPIANTTASGIDNKLDTIPKNNVIYSPPISSEEKDGKGHPKNTR